MEVSVYRWSEIKAIYICFGIKIACIEVGGLKKHEHIIYGKRV